MLYNFKSKYLILLIFIILSGWACSSSQKADDANDEAMDESDPQAQKPNESSAGTTEEEDVADAEGNGAEEEQGAADSTDTPPELTPTLLGQATVSTDNETKLVGGSATVTIPAQGFAEPMELEIYEGMVTTEDLQGTAVTPPVTLKFSEAAVTLHPYTVEIKLPESFVNTAGENSILLAAIKIEGESVESGESVDGYWNLTVGHFNGEAKTYSVTLFTSGEQISLVPVSFKRDEILVYVPEETEGRLDGHGNEFFALLARNAQAQASPAGGAGCTDAGWGARPWAVVCGILRENASEEEIARQKQRCGYDETKWESLRSMLAGASSAIAEDHEFGQAYILSTSREDAARLEGKGGIVGTDSEDDEAACVSMAFIIEAGKGCSDGALACYKTSNGAINIVNTVASGGNLRLSIVVAHEIFHSVQAKMIPLIFALDAYDWLNEGTADAIGLCVNGLDTEISEPGTGQSWRDWRKPLHWGKKEGEEDLPYQTHEFWGLIGEPCTYLNPLFQQLKGRSAQNPFSVIDPALQSVLGSTLSGLYLNKVLASRDPGMGYPYCTPFQGVASGDWLIEMGDLSPMSSTCYLVNVPADTEEATVASVTVASTIAQQKGTQWLGIMFMGGGGYQVTNGEDLIMDRQLVGSQFVIHVADIDMNRLTGSEMYEVAVKFEKEEKEEKEEEAAEAGGLPPCQEIWPRGVGGRPAGLCFNCCPGAFDRLLEIIRAEEEAERERRQRELDAEQGEAWDAIRREAEERNRQEEQ